MTSIQITILFVVYIAASFGLGIYAGFEICKSKKEKADIQGTLRVAYDVDDPGHPAMGMVIESVDYILTHDHITLVVEKKGFPNKK